MYILTSYSSSKNIFMYHNYIVLDAILSVDILPKNLFAKCFFSELTPFFDAMGAEVVAKGKLTDGGVEYNNRPYFGCD
ncbi:hypothetical protein AB4298_19230 [Shewanella sp. 10N.261.52.F9]|uniref:hypothetical protein n=1 Tax=Shewanella sp. 10N.261.52.F9 TaxID=3229684 RepID=UPI003553A280